MDFNFEKIVIVKTYIADKCKATYHEQQIFRLEPGPQIRNVTPFLKRP